MPIDGYPTGDGTERTGYRVALSARHSGMGQRRQLNGPSAARPGRRSVSQVR